MSDLVSSFCYARMFVRQLSHLESCRFQFIDPVMGCDLIIVVCFYLWAVAVHTDSDFCCQIFFRADLVSL